MKFAITYGIDYENISMRGQYSIHFCERAVKRWQSMDRFVLGNALSHPFLVLMNDSNEPVQECHGTWSSLNNRRQTFFAKKLEFALAASSIVGQEVPLHRMFSYACHNRLPVNRAIICTQPSQYRLREREETLLSGAREVIKEKWNHLKEIATQYDHLRWPYMRYAFGQSVNCQKILKAVMHDSFMPGWDTLDLKLGDAGWSSPYQLYSAASAASGASLGAALPDADFCNMGFKNSPV